MVSLGTFAVALSQRRSNLASARKYVADAGEVAAQSVGLLLGPLNEKLEKVMSDLGTANERIEKMQTERDLERESLKAERAARAEERRVMQAEIDELRAGVGVLVAQLEAAGLTPRYKPKTGPIKEKESKNGS